MNAKTKTSKKTLATKKSATKIDAAAVPAVAAPTPRADDGAELRASAKRGIMHKSYAHASLADLLVVACGASTDGFASAIDAAADELDMLFYALVEGDAAGSVCASPAVFALERRLRVIAEVQRRIDGARTVSK